MPAAPRRGSADRRTALSAYPLRVPQETSDTAVSTHPVDVDGVRERVNTALEDFLDDQGAALRSVAPDTAPLFDAVADLVRGGKRLRAAFCYWGWRATGAPDGPEIVRASTAMELFQAAALIHDDVMDGSDTRRGMPSVHRRLAGLHAGSGWQGDPERFGLSGAVLAGDLCLVWSGELFHGSGLAPQALARARAPFDRMRTELMTGQYLDVLEQAVAGQHPDGAVERARRVIRYKSAKYSVQEPLLIGGALAGADERVLAGYTEFGLLLGEAFQLRDDVLGVFGDPALTGKPAGDDLREGKRTVLVALALAAASPEQGTLLTAGLGDPLLDVDRVDRLREVMVTTGALAEVEDRIATLVRGAREVLVSLDLAQTGRVVLDRLVAAATSRSA